jgi:DNA-3-methyladenine glycosylase II
LFLNDLIQSLLQNTFNVLQIYALHKKISENLNIILLIKICVKNKMNSYNKLNFRTKCDELVAKHKCIATLFYKYNYPPYWKRVNNFESFVKTILEQQVSLASARAVFSRLQNALPKITYTNILDFGIENLKQCGITKQKANYIFGLAEIVNNEKSFFKNIEKLNDDEVKQKLISIKGIGIWSANVYMLTSLNRLNIYPPNDVALIKGIAMVAFKNEKINNVAAEKFIAQFAPLQSIAVCFYYWAYICEKKIEFIP